MESGGDRFAEAIGMGGHAASPFVIPPTRSRTARRPAISATRLITMTALLVIGAIALAALVVGLSDGARGGTVGDLVAAGSGAVVLALVALPSWRIGMLSRRGGAFRRQLVRITMLLAMIGVTLIAISYASRHI